MSHTAVLLSSPSVSRNFLREETLAWSMSLALSVTVLLIPALWNEFAVVYYDTGGYVERVLNMNLGFGRSFFYGVFLWLASLGWWSFFGPVLVQAVLTVWLVYMMLRCHDLPCGPFDTCLMCAGLGVSTGISWYVSQLMPDMLVPLTVIVLWLFASSWHKLNGVERVGLTVIALLGLLSHMSCMVLAVGLIGVLAMLRFINVRWQWRTQLSIVPPAAVVVASLILMPLLHGLILGKVGYTPGGPAFIYGRLVQDRIAQRWLAEHCPAPGIALCSLQDRLPDTGDAFLWNTSSPFFDIGGWSGAADAELNYLVRESVASYPLSTLSTAVVAAAEQLVMVRTGEGLDKYHHAVRGTFNNALPQEISRQFNAARQQQGGFSPLLFAVFSLLHIPIALVSTFGLLAVIALAVYHRHRDVAGLAVFVFCALAGNAFICGAMSGPHHRYQSRIVWLATLVLVMAVIHWWRSREHINLRAVREETTLPG